MAKLMEDGCVVLDPFESHALDKALRAMGFGSLRSASLEADISDMVTYYRRSEFDSELYQELCSLMRRQLYGIHADTESDDGE